MRESESEGRESTSDSHHYVGSRIKYIYAHGGMPVCKKDPTMRRQKKIADQRLGSVRKSPPVGTRRMYACTMCTKEKRGVTSMLPCGSMKRPKSSMNGQNVLISERFSTHNLQYLGQEGRLIDGGILRCANLHKVVQRDTCCS